MVQEILSSSGVEWIDGLAERARLTGLPRRFDKGDDVHRRLALGTFKDGSVAWSPGIDDDTQHELHEGELSFGVAGQEAIVSNPAKALG